MIKKIRKSIAILLCSYLKKKIDTCELHLIIIPNGDIINKSSQTSKDTVELSKDIWK